MANLRVSDRDLLVDEILKRLKKEYPTRDERLKNIIKEQGLKKSFEKIDQYSQKLEELEQQKEALEETRSSLIKDLEKQVGYDNSSTWRRRDYSKIEEYLLSVNDTLPSKKQLETAILLAQGGDDMNALMVSIIEQFKNK